jgi:hypothetical protein
MARTRVTVKSAASAAARIATDGVIAGVTSDHRDRIHRRNLSTTAFRLSVHPENR